MSSPGEGTTVSAAMSTPEKIHSHALTAPPPTATAVPKRQSHSEDAHSLRPPRMTPATIVLLSAGLPEGTRRAYASDRADFALFMSQRGEPPLPPTAEALADYGTCLLMVGSPSVASPRPLCIKTVERRLSAVSTWSVEHGYGRPDLRAVRLVLRGHRRTVGSDRPARAAPVSVNTLRALVAQAGDASGSPGATPARVLRDRAMILIGFALGARRSELVAVDLQDFTITTEGMVVRVLRAKTRVQADLVAVPWAADPAMCPVRALLALRAKLGERGIETGPAFRRITRTDVVLSHRLSPEAVADLVARTASNAKVPVPEGFRSWSGHSLRRGMATEARRAGADPLKIARQGGWADGSSTLAVYMAEVDQWLDHALKGVL